MRHIASLIAAASICAFTSLAAAQAPALSRLDVGDPVDFKNNGQWTPCAISAPLKDGIYGVHCAQMDTKAKADPSELRLHVVGSSPVRQAIESKALVSMVPEGESIGAQYGTRNPRTCDSHKGAINSVDARDLFICDAEHEFGGSLYLVSDVSLLVSDARRYNPNEDAAKASIDATQPVFDIRASYNNFQCSKLPSTFLDYPGNRNCNQFKMSNAAGSCFKNTSGEWHCMMYDFHRAAQADAKNVKPPTLAD